MCLIHPLMACLQTWGGGVDIIPTRTEIIDFQLVYSAINKAAVNTLCCRLLRALPSVRLASIKAKAETFRQEMK